MRNKSHQICPFSFADHEPNLIHQSIDHPSTIPNDIQIHSTILPQYTRVDRQTDYTVELYIESSAANNINES